MFEVINEAVRGNSYLSNSIVSSSSQHLTLRLRENIDGNWAIALITVTTWQGECKVEATLEGYEAVNEDGQVILVDSIKSKEVLGW